MSRASVRAACSRKACHDLRSVGRDIQVRQQAGEHVFEQLKDFFLVVYEKIPFALSFEMVEIDPVLTFKKNNIHDYLS